MSSPPSPPVPVTSVANRTATVVDLPKRWIFLAASVLAAHVAVLFSYVSLMAADGHYQFFPLVYAVFGGLMWHRRDRVLDSTTRPRPWLLATVLVVDWLLVTVATLLFSGFFGVISLILAIAVLLYALVGWGGLRRSLPMLCLLLCVIPMPLNWDFRLIIQLQHLASRVASVLLDGLGLVHFREGVVLVTGQTQFITEEACSGIRSLFSTIASIVIAGVCFRMGWARIVFNLLQSVVWVLLGNAIRVAFVVYLTDQSIDWFAEGLGHDLLSLVVFAFILTMVFSTDAIVQLILRILTVDHEHPDESPGWVPRWFDRSAASDPAPPTRRTGPGAGLSPTFATVWIVAFLLTTLLATRVVYARGLGRVAAAVTADDWSGPPRDALPSQIGPWEQINFETVERSIDSFQGRYSSIWTYRFGDHHTVVSVDGPWDEWHNLGVCYLGLGWQTESRDIRRSGGGAAVSRPRVYTELDLNKPDRFGRVLFCSVDRNGNDMVFNVRRGFGDLAEFSQQFLRQVGQSLGLAQVEDIQLPAKTIQLYWEGGKTLSPTGESRMRQLFLDSYTLISGSQPPIDGQVGETK